MREVSWPLMVRMRCSVISLCNLESCWKRVRRIDPERVQPGRERSAFDGGNNGWDSVQIQCLPDATDEAAADNALMDERLALPQPPGAGEVGETRGRAGAARRPIDRPVAIKHGIPTVGPGPLQPVRPHDMTHTTNGGIERMNRLERRTHQRAHHG